MTANNQRRVADTVSQLRQLAERGFTYKQASIELGIGYATVSRHAVDYKIPLRRGTQGPRPGRQPNPRAAQMAALYRCGKTLAQIGEQYGITRERVRQLITVHHGLTAKDGGMRRASQEAKAKRDAARNQSALKKYGCSWDQYVQLRSMKKPTRAFCQQRKNADSRGIGWELNLWQWWSIWLQSGHWAERGRGRGYMMCRIGDDGPYAVGNVFIATGCENSSDQKRKKSGLPRGVRKNMRYRGYSASKMINGRLYRLGSSFATPELAHAAYLAFDLSSVPNNTERAA